MSIKSTRETKTIDLCIWCRKLNLYGKYQVSVNIRFGIAIYQIYQALKWGNNECSYESFAASCIHFMVSAEMLDVDLYTELPKDLYDLPRCCLNHEELLLNICSAQQQIHYGSAGTSKNMKRKNRYDEKILKERIANIIKMLMGQIPKTRRRDAIEIATEIMTGTL